MRGGVAEGLAGVSSVLDVLAEGLASAPSEPNGVAEVLASVSRMPDEVAERLATLSRMPNKVAGASASPQQRVGAGWGYLRGNCWVLSAGLTHSCFMRAAAWTRC